MNKETNQILKNQQAILYALWNSTNCKKTEEIIQQASHQTTELLDDVSRSEDEQ